MKLFLFLLKLLGATLAYYFLGIYVLILCLALWFLLSIIYPCRVYIFKDPCLILSPVTAKIVDIVESELHLKTAFSLSSLRVPMASEVKKIEIGKNVVLQTEHFEMSLPKRSIVYNRLYNKIGNGDKIVQGALMGMLLPFTVVKLRVIGLTCDPRNFLLNDRVFERKTILAQRNIRHD